MIRIESAPSVTQRLWSPQHKRHIHRTVQQYRRHKIVFDVKALKMAPRKRSLWGSLAELFGKAA